MSKSKTAQGCERNDDYQRQKTLEGAHNSARLRSERAKEPVREVVELGDGTRITVHVTYAEHRNGMHRTMVPLDLVERYPIVYDFIKPKPGDGGAGDESDWQHDDDVNVFFDCVVKDAGYGDELCGIRVEGALKGFKHQVLRSAKAALGQAKPDGLGHCSVVLPGDFKAHGLNFTVRLLYWTSVLDERLELKRDFDNRVVCDGESDIETIAEDDDVDDSSCVTCGADGNPVSAIAQYDQGYGMCDLLSAIDAALEQVSEVDAYIFRRHYVEDADFKEIAAELGKANSSMTYAMKRVLPVVQEFLLDAGFRI